MSDRIIHVVKLGGSLLDFDRLFDRFARFRAERLRGSGLLVLGGGKAANLVRQFHRLHPLELSVGHDLCVRAMQFNSFAVVSKLPDARIVRQNEECAAAWDDGQLAVVDPVAWLEYEQATLDISIPRRWTFTSDSIAAHLTNRLGAQYLTLLKSTIPAMSCDVDKAISEGIVDGDFEATSSEIANIELVNLRDEKLPKCILR